MLILKDLLALFLTFQYFAIFMSIFDPSPGHSVAY